MLCWWAYQPTFTTVCSQCSALLRDPSAVYDALTTSPTHSPVSSGPLPERVQFKLVTIVYRSLNGTAAHYLAADLRRLSDMPSRRCLQSSLTDQLDVRQPQCSTVGYRAFAVAGAPLWNSLPPDIVASDTLSRFRYETAKFFMYLGTLHYLGRIGSRSLKRDPSVYATWFR